MMNTASVVRIVGIERKRSSGNFKSSLKNLVRTDASRGITESSREYIAQKTTEELRTVAPSANKDISTIRDTVLHLGNIVAKNTADRISAVTNVIDAREAEEDRRGVVGVTSGGAGLDTFGILQLYATKSAGITWFSTAWNTNPRTVSQGNVDPNDTRFWFGSDLPIDTPLNITGDGTGLAYVDQANQGVWFGVTDTWLNTETTLHIYIDESDTTTDRVECISRSTGGNCNFTGYVSRFTMTNAQHVVWPLNNLDTPLTEKVVSISDFLSGLPRNQWIGLKSVIRTKTLGLTTPDVICEMYVNYNIDNQTLNGWNLVASFQYSESLVIPPSWIEDDLALSCAALGDLTADKIIANNSEVFAKLTAGNQSWWNIKNVSKFWLKYVSVREIDPLP